MTQQDQNSANGGKLPLGTQDQGQADDGRVTRAAYVPPQITSSKIFHKVLLTSPAPGIPGCSTY